MAQRRIIGTFYNPVTLAPWDGGRLRAQLLSRFSSVQIVYPRNGVTYTCDQNGQVDFFLNVPDGGVQAARYLFTFPDNSRCEVLITSDDDTPLDLGSVNCFESNLTSIPSDDINDRLVVIEAILACLRLKPASIGQILIFDGSLWVAGDNTGGGGGDIPNPGGVGQIIVSDGTNWIVSDNVVGLPNPGGVGQIIMSDGTNWIISDNVVGLPNPGTDDQIIVSNSGNWIVSDNVDGLPSPGTVGQIIASNGVDWIVSDNVVGLPNPGADDQILISSDGGWTLGTLPGGGGSGVTVPRGTIDRSTLEYSIALASWVEHDWPPQGDRADDGDVMRYDSVSNRWVTGAFPTLGTGDINVSSQVNSLPINALPLAILEERTVNNADAGTATATTSPNDWDTRVLTHEKHKSQRGISLNGQGHFLLPSGAYFIDAFSTAYRVNQHGIALYNETESEFICFGSSAYSDAGNIINTTSELKTVFVATTQTEISLRHAYQATKANNGKGFASWQNGVPRDYELWSRVIISGFTDDKFLSSLVMAIDFEDDVNSTHFLDEFSGYGFEKIGTVSTDTGINGNCASLSPNNYLVSNAPKLSLTASLVFGVAFWVKLDSFDFTVGMMETDGTGLDWYISVYQSNKIRFGVGIEYKDVTLTSPLQAGQWYHVAFSWAGRFYYWLDNDPAPGGTVSVNNNQGAIQRHSQRNIVIGPAASPPSFIDEFRLYYKILDNDIVNHWYNNGLGRPA